MKTRSYLFFWMILFTFGLGGEIKAQHQFGGEITYENIGQDTMKITLTLYKDCAAGTYPSTDTVFIEGLNCNFTLPLQLEYIQDVTPICASMSSPCQGGTALPYGVEKLRYSDTIVLPSNCIYGSIQYQSCCRSIDLTNLDQPGTQSFFIETSFDNSTLPKNNSPVFTTDPLVITCSQQPVVFNPGATDPDGDSLSFALVDCRQSPFVKVDYLIPQVIITTGGMSFSPTTGTISFTPDGAQQSVWCMKVEEFRNGKKIGEMYRDLRIVVLGSNSCTNPPPSISGVNGTNKASVRVCPGQPVDFTIYTSDPNPLQKVALDTPLSGMPMGNLTIYPALKDSARFTWTPGMGDIGFHFFVLSAKDDGCPLAAKTLEAFSIEVREPNIKLPDTVSINCGNQAGVPYSTSVDFDSLAWAPAPDSVNGDKVYFSPNKTTVYQVTGSNGFCSATDSITVVVKDLSITANIQNELDTLCNGGIIINMIDGTPPYNYLWNTGDTTATLTDLCAGDYHVTVVDSNGCSGEAVFVVEKKWHGIEGISGLKAFNVFPNPATDRLYVSLEMGQPSAIQLSLCTLDGKTVLPSESKENVQEWSYEMDVSGLPKGVYLLQLRVDNKFLTRRVTLL